MNYSGYFTDNDGNRYYLEKSVITLSLHENLTVSTTNVYTKLNALKEDCKAGTALSTNNGGVVIGKGVRKVLVSGVMSVLASVKRNEHSRIIRVRDGQEEIISWNYNGFEAQQLNSIVLTPVVFDVKENDIIYMLYYSEKNDILQGNTFGKRTSITVEVVE